MTVTWTRGAAAVLLVAATVTGCASESPSPVADTAADTAEPGSSATPSDALLWSDEFDGPAGQRPDDRRG